MKLVVNDINIKRLIYYLIYYINITRVNALRSYLEGYVTKKLKDRDI